MLLNLQQQIEALPFFFFPHYNAKKFCLILFWNFPTTTLHRR